MGRQVESDLYRVFQETMPIACADALLWQPAGGGLRELLLIVRDVPGEAEWGRGLALIGGRVERDESITEALERHLVETVGPDVRWDETSFDVDRPGAVGQYFPRRTDAFPFDPRQHSIALSYLVRLADLDQRPRARGEAVDVRWVREDALTRDDVGFGQWRVIETLLGRSLSE